MAEGDLFPDAATMKVAFDRRLMVAGRQSRADKRVSGGNAKLYRCTGAVITDKVKGATGCQVRLRACKQHNKEWRVTELVLDHTSCTGQSGEKKQRPSRKALAPEAAALVNANHSISSGALAKTLKATAGVEFSERTANRMRADVLGKSKKELREQYQYLASYLDEFKGNNGNVVEHEVRTWTSRKSFWGACLLCWRVVL